MITQRVWFYRFWKAKFGGSNGGNLKVRDAFNCIDDDPDINALLCIDEDTIWNDFPGNHWLDLRSRAVDRLQLVLGDVLFLSGKDWRCLPPEERWKPKVPVINVVQPRHTRHNDPRNEFLKYPAIRIAKSNHGARILKDHGVNGPLIVVPDSIDLDLIPRDAEKDIDVVVIGLKDPDLAKKIYYGLQDWAQKNRMVLEIQLPPKLPTREDFLHLIARSKIVVCVPLPLSQGGEGFYLPPLEAMACQSLVVTSLAIGNVDHCLDEINCLVANNDEHSYIKRVIELWDYPERRKEEMISNGLITADRHSIVTEREHLLKIVKEAYSTWGNFKKD